MNPSPGTMYELLNKQAKIEQINLPLDSQMTIIAQNSALQVKKEITCKKLGKKNEWNT